MKPSVYLFRLAAAWALLCSCSAQAAEIQSFELDSETSVIFIEGDIVAGDSETFRKEAAKHEAAIVWLESNGGSTVDAIEIGEAIRLRGFSTFVVNGSECASACALIWLAGTPRTLSESARVGFHATYTDQKGQRLESGVGNALVGRYFTLLNLPLKAIIFATEAPPHGMNWLNQSNSQQVGIEAKFVSNWVPNETADSAGEALPETQATPRNSATSLWKNVNQWSVMVDHTIGDSCFMLTGFEDGTALRIGLDRVTGGQSYFMLGNEAWASLTVGDIYPIELQFDQETPWEANAQVVDLNGGRFLKLTFSDNLFWAEVALSKSLLINRGKRRVAALSLDGSQSALDTLLECQGFYNEQWNGRDPFEN